MVGNTLIRIVSIARNNVAAEGKVLLDECPKRPVSPILSLIHINR
jgi:hypothetical protein